ncbi:MAG: hypothetical protein MZW92_47090 [Comamonadaceae bacterium]|nr:hypothetical protein [Comamonadaceae bacterium]
MRRRAREGDDDDNRRPRLRGTARTGCRAPRRRTPARRRRPTPLARLAHALSPPPAPRPRGEPVPEFHAEAGATDRRALCRWRACRDAAGRHAAVRIRERRRAQGGGAVCRYPTPWTRP